MLGERDIPLIGVVIPYAETFRPDWGALTQRGHPALDADHATESAERILTSAGARVVSVRQRILSSGQPPRDYFFPDGRDDKHLSDLGHYAVAASIFEEIRALGLSEHVEPPTWSDLCAPRLRRVALRIREIPREEFAQPSKRPRRLLAREARAAADAVGDCRIGAAVDVLDGLLAAVQGADALVGGSPWRGVLAAEVGSHRAAVAAGHCGECR